MKNFCRSAGIVLGALSVMAAVSMSAPFAAHADELVDPEISYVPAATFEGNDGLPVGAATMSSQTSVNDPGPSEGADDIGGDAALPQGSTLPFEPPGVTAIPDAPAGIWSCTVYASDPTHTVENGRQVIEGEGMQGCWGAGWQAQRLKIRVQQYRGSGYWRTKYEWISGWTYSDFISRSVWWYCASGTGTQTYRIVSTGYADNGAQALSVQSENYLRVKCPL